MEARKALTSSQQPWGAVTCHDVSFTDLLLWLWAEFQGISSTEHQPLNTTKHYAAHIYLPFETIDGFTYTRHDGLSYCISYYLHVYVVMQ